MQENYGRRGCKCRRWRIPVIHFNQTKVFCVKNIIFCFLIVSIVITFFHCAGQMAPPGGPVDTTPPTITETYPETKTTNFNDHAIRITFSEWVDKQSVFESIFISPDVGELELDWSGREIEITFEDTLRENTTYVLTLGTDVKDLRAGNTMAEAFSLAFSTGGHIDSGALGGKIFDGKPEGVMVFAYMLDARLSDTLNPAQTKPDYLTQTGKDGTFYLPFLRLGNYRLIAMRDEYKNLIYDAQIDQYGVPQSEFVLTPEKDLMDGITIRMTSEDTSAPFLSSSRAIDQQHVLLRFSEAIDTSTLRQENIFIEDTLSQAQLSVIDASPSDTTISEATLLTAEQDGTKTYRVRIKNIRDLYGNVVSLKTTAGYFDGSGVPDTTKPHISLLNIVNESKEVFPGDSILIGINEWVIKSKAEHGFSLQDSGKNSLTGAFTWLNATHARFVPSIPLQNKMPYVVSVILDSLIDIAGNRFTDSMQIFKFQTVDNDKLGSIVGTIEKGTLSENGRIFLSAKPLEEKLRSRTVSLSAPGKFSFDKLQEGKYLLSAFVDSDSNSVYAYGTLYPFQTSERFIVYDDTVKVRARWSVENVKILFK
ncbi:MAG: hypothetical protein EPO24_16575 [Bacteroidetes bacterium]|nr:MAG: hypothetical protein EPO24_16575 [Bacteroidota bacterium]